MGLRLELNKLIQVRGYVSRDEVDEFCKLNGYLMSNAERRLRLSESPLVEAVRVRGQRGESFVKGWKWAGSELGSSRQPIHPIQAVEPHTGDSSASEIVDSIERRAFNRTWDGMKLQIEAKRQEDFRNKLK